MHPTYNRYNLEPTFKKYLLAENINPASIKHYLSDFRHFFGWISFEVSISEGRASLQETNLHEYITSELIKAYKTYLSQGDNPHKTINRRLSTVRKLCAFLHDQGLLSENPAAGISNVQEHVSQYPQTNLETHLDAYRQHLSTSIDAKKHQYLISDIEELLAVIHSKS